MATLKPFRALRPKPELAPRVCTLPYDVMNTQEARTMAGKDAANFLHVTRPEIEFPDSADSHAPEMYLRAKANLQKLVADGTLVRDAKPCYYIYRLTMGTHRQTGIVALASCSEYDRNIVRKHELTRPDKEDDRTLHIGVTECQTGPVFLTFRSDAEFDKYIAGLASGKPTVDFTAEGDIRIRHEMWVVGADADVQRIEKWFAALPATYIADGHHRSAAASRVARALGGNGTEPWHHFLTVSFPDTQVQILGYNRVVKDLNGHTAKDVLAALAKLGTIADAPADHLPRRKNEATFFLDGKWQLLTWKPEVASKGDAVAQLDVSILQDRFLAPTLGIGDPRTDKRIAFVGGIRGPQELERVVRNGENAIAFCMFPTSVADLMEIADQGGLMPPKSTWFEPKLRDAMTLHVIGKD